MNHWDTQETEITHLESDDVYLRCSW